MKKRLNAFRDEAGFTIIEVMVAAFLLILGLLGVATMADQAAVSSNTSKARVGATNLARELLEDARGFKYSELTGTLPPASGPTDLQTAFAGTGVTDAFPSTPGFQIRRRGITYNVGVFTCVFDDGHDGIRAAPASGTDVHASGPYCQGSSAAGSGPTTDGNPDDARKVEVSVTWALYGVTPGCRGANQTSSSAAATGTARACVTQSELIANPTGGLGPAIVSLTQHTAGPIEPNRNGLVVMDVKTSSAAQSMTWNAGGATGAAALAAGDTDSTNWTFTWGPLGSSSPVDGTQLVTAQAFLLNAAGVPKRAAVNLNRFIPAVPTGLTGGIARRLSDAAAISWGPNSDQDIFGYTVYRARASGTAPNLTGSTPDAPVCSTTSVSSTTCFDAPSDLQSFATTAACKDPVAQAANDKCINYYVVPFDSRWTVFAEPAGGVYTATQCPGTPWNPFVTVPVPPVPAASSTAPITGLPQWSNARAGCPSAFISLDYTELVKNHAPDPPTQLTCSTDAGQPVIGWTAPSSPDQDGDAVANYRIYRDPAGNTDPRYDDPATTIGYNNGTTNSYRDSADTLGAAHDYWITAVDARFAESAAQHIQWTAATCP